MKPLDIIDAPPLIAHHTSWAVDTENSDVLVFVLHDKDDNAIASASYRKEDWMEVFSNLLSSCKTIGNA